MRLSVILAAAGTAIFAAVAAAVAAAGSAPFDAVGRAAVHAHASPALTLPMRALSAFGETGVLIPLSMMAAAGFLLTGHKRAAIFFAAAMAGALVLDLPLKLAFHRARPPASFFGTAMPRSFSFPSGHALYAACFFGSVAAIGAAHVQRRRRRVALWAAAGAIAFAIGLSRVYLGVHYPSDVLAGFAAGTAWMAAITAAYRPT